MALADVFRKVREDLDRLDREQDAYELELLALELAEPITLAAYRGWARS
mgnify:CR=1 FL=1